MSADQWSKCPQCAKVGQATLDAYAREINEAYGKVLIEEFDRMRATQEHNRIGFSNRPATFREDIEVTGAEDGVVHIKYRGYCKSCNLTLDVDEDYSIPWF